MINDGEWWVVVVNGREWGLILLNADKQWQVIVGN